MTELVKWIVQLPNESNVEGDPLTELWIREGTDDEAVVRECFRDDVYHTRVELRPTPPARIDDPDMVDWRPRIIDLGACFGAFSALACQMFPNADVMAVEPNPDNFELLRMNTEPWEDRVGRYQFAVGGDQRFVRMEGEGATGHTNGMLDPDAPGAIEQVTLEQLIAGRQVAMLKVDVEGAEWAIFDACPVESLALVDQMSMEWHGPRMAPWAFTTAGNVHYGDLLHKLAFTHAVNVFGDPWQGGMLFAHRYD